MAVGLDQIEIMTNPPAKYDASGNSGVINIKTKKTKTVGYNGSVTGNYGQGVYPKANLSTNLNYRENKVNLFANGSYFYGENFGKLEIMRKFRDQEKLILGICNGFQVMLKAGLLLQPDEDGPIATLAHNDSGHYEDRWVHLQATPGKCPFLRGVERLHVPIGHGEGKFVCRTEWELKGLSEQAGQVVLREEYFSTGGGFVVRGEEFGRETAATNAVQVPHPFTSAQELLALARDSGLDLHELVLDNERAFRPDTETRAALLHVWAVMSECIERGFKGSGVLPGVLKVRRRAERLYRQLTESGEKRPLDALEWVNAFALAVNEENAAGGRVVTAPTNGAAGIVPAVLAYYRKFEPGASEEGVVRFLLVAGAIGMLYKRNASISGAEMGCQGEVGVACSMAAAGLVAALNGTNEQIENAAEIGMEHNLGLTCDPIAGLVQIPCIERNAMGAVKAINAARLSLRGDGTHKVSLDQVIATMRQTGHDMSTIYKETSQGGLAVNVPEC